ncbi:hypothetical protein DYB31_003929, partial [Aphanomyces astaci]
APATTDVATSAPPKTFTILPTDIVVATTELPVTASVVSQELLNGTTRSPTLSTTQAPLESLVEKTSVPKVAVPGAPNGDGSKLQGEEVAPDNNSNRQDKRRDDLAGKTDEEIQDIKATITSGYESKTEQTLRYVSSSVVGITLVLLAFFQFIAMNPSYILPDSPSDRLAAPNSWEFPAFVFFIQQVGVLSLAKNTKVPHKFYVSFLDSLSWLVFLIRGSPSADSNNAAVSSSQLVAIGGGRSLVESSTYDAQGKIQFSLRSDVNDKDWFMRVWVAVLVVIAVLMVFVICTALISQWVAQRGNPFHSDTTDSHKRSVSFRSISRRLLGMCVLVGFFSILPLSMISMFEVLQDASTAGFPHIYAILSLVTLALVVGSVLYGMYALQSLTEAGLSKWRTRVVWGVVYSNYHYTSRLFFAAGALVQFLTGILVAAVTGDAFVQLLCLVIVHALYLVSMFVLQPFVCNVHFKFAIGFQVLILVVFSLACGLAGDSISNDTQLNLSYAIVILLIIVFVVMFIRQLYMLWTYASAWAKDEHDSVTGMPTLHDHEIESGGGNYTISLRDTEDHGHSSGGKNAVSLHNSGGDDSPMNTIRIVDTNSKRHLWMDSRPGKCITTLLACQEAAATAATLVGSRIFVFGGYDGRRNHNDLHIFDCDTLSWETYTDPRSSNQDSTPPSLSAAFPASRNGHTATLAHNSIYILGGWLGSGPHAANDLHILHVNSMRWESPITTGTPPGPCNMHTTDYLPNVNGLLVFRGGDGKEYLNDLHLFDLPTRHWSRPTTHGTPPSPRANHSSAVLDHRLFVFGGWNGTHRLNDLHMLDTTTWQWTSIPPSSEGSMMLPFPRAGMTFVAVRRRFFLFGGYGSSPNHPFPAKCFSDLHVLDTDQTSTHWTPVVPSGHSTCTPPAYRSRDPRVVTVEGVGPSRRAGHTCTVVGRRLFIFGGSHHNEYLNDMHVLDTDPSPQAVVALAAPPMDFNSALRPYANSPTFSDISFVRSSAAAIVIPNMSRGGFEAMMAYVYSGHVVGEMGWEDLLELLVAADQYMLDHLKQVCERQLQLALDKDNVGFLMEAAERANASQLMAVCRHFVRNYADKESTRHANDDTP